ncbi:MAG: hypothetical protein MUE72_01865 [Chitinophagaceae bacterium]|nr:hypothetical protein [Chitinophagaceae bacterium]
MRIVSIFFFCYIFLFSCKEDKVNLLGDTPVKVNDFIAAFPIVKLPFSIADSNFAKVGDTIQIGRKVLQQFVPDSILINQLNLTEKSIVHPVGRIEKEEETYLLVKHKNNKKLFLHVLVFSKKNEFLANKLLLDNTNNDDYLHSVVINREPTFSINKDRMDRSLQQLMYTRTGWAFTVSAGTFINVVNETNEDEKRNNTIINPIDTLPKKYKYSGNYVQNDKNFISLRDGSKPNTYLFFIHFEKNNGSCIGELKGEIKMKDEKEGIYSESNDPCLIDFKFNRNEITVKEQGSCGNYRGIKCYFNDSYTKKKEATKKKK